jgi:hypothetical protein
MSKRKGGKGSDPTSEAYQKGRKAYKEGRLSEANPYPGDSGDSEDRYQWFMGYYDERTEPIIKKEPSWKTPTKVQNQ